MASRGEFLVVEDDSAAAKALWRVLEAFRPTRVVHSGTEARNLLDAGHTWCGLLVDAQLGDISGLEVLAHARQRYPVVPAVVVTGYLERELINRAFALGAGYVCKPFGREALLPFISRALASESTSDERVQRMIEHLAQRHGLSAREVAVLVYAVQGVPRQTILREMGVSHNTLKSHVRALLRKLDAGSMGDVAVGVLRTALMGAA